MALYRGLATFISDLRNCKSKEAEQQRVDKELANVRMAFASGKMSPYDRKKYVWKLVYVNMLGHDVDFGHMEMIALLSAPTYAEKLVGYMSVAVMMRNTDPQITLVVQAIKNDLQSTQDPTQCLALCAIANIGGKELAETVVPDVQRILFSRSIFPIVRKKAALCLLRLVRINKDVVLSSDEWKNKLTPLLEDKNLGVVLCVVSLILGLSEAAGKDAGLYDGCTGHLLVWLTRLAVQKQVAEDYMYHAVACPWLQVKILRLLQQFPIPPTEAMRGRLEELLSHILNKTEVTKSVNRNNAEHCVLFEAVTLIIKQGDASLPELRAKAIAHLSKFINIREPNIRYLGLDMMARILTLDGCGDAIRKQQATIMFSVKDADISIRRRALALLFALCNKDIAAVLVKDLLAVLAMSDWQIRDEMALKIAILAERYSPDKRWFVDTIIQLINIAGDHVSDDIWHRLVQVITNNEDLHLYAASRLYHTLEPATAHETAIKAGAYILGEFGYTLNESDIDGAPAIVGAQQFAVLHQHFTRCSLPTKCILLSAYAKLQNLYPEIKAIVTPVFEAHTSVLDAELQQRAVEYLHLPELSDDTLSSVLDAMPAFPERASLLEAKLKKQGEEKQDKDVWGQENKQATGGAGASAEDDEGAGEAVAEDVGAAGGAMGGGGGMGGGARGGAAAAASDDLDLLGLVSSAPTPSAPPAAPTDAASVPVTRNVGVDPALANTKVPAWLHTATVRASGVLYEDAHVQLGVKRSFSGAEGKVSLFIGNKTSVPFVALKFRVPDFPSVRCTVGDVVASVPPRSQAQVHISCEALTPFSSPPVLQVSFISEPGMGHAYALRVPVAVSSFCEPVPMAAADFKTRWGALAGAPREATVIVSPASGSGAVTLAAATTALSDVLRMSAVDAGAPGATGASTFRTKSTTPAGAPISVGCLAMAIPDAAGGCFKVAVRTQHGEVSKSLVDLLKAHLEAL